MTTIPIFFTFDRYFVLAAGVAFHTLLKHASPGYHYRLYVVHTGLKPHHQRRLQRVVQQFSNASLVFKDASGYDTGWERLQNKSHFSKEIFYKLTAAEMFPEYDRILFSDVDVIFTHDIAPSYFLYPGERFYYAGARPILTNESLPGYRKDFTPEEVDAINYYEFSAGYMLINLKCMREDGMQAKLIDFFHRNLYRLRLPEQDCIALCCKPCLRFMDYKYVVCNYMYAKRPESLEFNTNNPLLADRRKALCLFREMLDDVVQLHYPGAEKPWNNPRVLKYDAWKQACRDASLYGYYLRLQPLFVWQRLQRYSLKRFVKKQMKRFG